MALGVERPGRLPVARRLLKLAGWSAFLAPIGIFLHELGHFFVGLLLGFAVQLNVGSVSGGPTLGKAADGAVALQASAGPFVTIALMALAAIGLRHRPVPSWALALAITAPLRFVVGGTYLFWVAKAWMAGTAFQGTPNFDEYNAALALGLSPAWLLVVQMCALISYWVWAIAKAPLQRRIVSVGCVLIGAVAGVGFWMAAVGPVLLDLV